MTERYPSVACPGCGVSSLTRSALYGSSARSPVRCESCGAEVRVRWWFRRLPHALGGFVLVAALVSFLLASWLPLVVWFALLVAGHWLVWRFLSNFLISRVAP